MAAICLISIVLTFGKSLRVTEVLFYEKKSNLHIHKEPLKLMILLQNVQIKRQLCFSIVVWSYYVYDDERESLFCFRMTVFDCKAHIVLLITSMSFLCSGVCTHIQISKLPTPILLLPPGHTGTTVLKKICKAPLRETYIDDGWPQTRAFAVCMRWSWEDCEVV